jgi:porphobilinogen synthase
MKGDTTMPETPDFRFRRLRGNSALRDLVRESRLHADDFILPLFVEEGIDEPVPVVSMPGVVRHTERGLTSAVRQAWQGGIKAIMLFGVSHCKDADGSDSWARDGLMARCIAIAKAAEPRMLVISDNCFCEYTEHGHCGVVVDGDVDNDLTLANLGRQAVVAAQAGADMIAPSGMMDGMVRAIRLALDQAGYSQLPIMSYSTKFASAFYGPFRDAVDSNFKGDRLTYQMDVANAREAVAESLQDEAEGADILMVKPGGAFLDILYRLRQHSSRPLAAYQVSGEYAMIKAAAAAGVIDERAIAMESLHAFKRAGADLIISYFALDAVQWLSPR